MRACEGCRKRKIKCDAATTNQWPCGSCVRLKQPCIPPTLNYDRSNGGGGHNLGLERVLDFDNSEGSGDDDYPFPGGPQVFELQAPQDHMHVPQGPYSAGFPPFHTPPHSDKAFSQHEYPYDDVATMGLPLPDPQYPVRPSYDPSHGISFHPSNSSGWQSDLYSPSELSDVLGDLKINETGVGKYCNTVDLHSPGAASNLTVLISHSTVHFATKKEPC